MATEGTRATPAMEDNTDDRSFEQRWRIIHGETPTDPARGDFVYAVLTTGIYCRPDCRSKKPRRDNTSFFDDWQRAERAGYRPCKRCRPRGEDAETLAVQCICEVIDAAEDMPGLAELAAAAGISPDRLRRLFRKRLGMSPRDYAVARRRRRLRETLAGAASVTEAFYDAGYGGSSRFYEDEGLRLGMKPDRYRRGGEGEAIDFLVVDSPLGRMLVARTDKGVCAIDFGDDDRALEQALRHRFDAATIRREADDGSWNVLVPAIVTMIEQPGRSHSLPLDIRGTVFEERVWQALLDIPCGETRSYGEVAVAIGSPAAVRAVAGACARNPLLVAVPCHRVVRGDGSTGGYRAGTERKVTLLERERQADGGRSA
ncbi:MAG: bifunctional DNA-binding transcriptional regulator/O6-methylguanine-DNA methyltransferase Ada [Geminicoccaceae bacterium]